MFPFHYNNHDILLKVIDYDNFLTFNECYIFGIIKIMWKTRI